MRFNSLKCTTLPFLDYKAVVPTQYSLTKLLVRIIELDLAIIFMYTNIISTVPMRFELQKGLESKCGCCKNEALVLD